MNAWNLVCPSCKSGDSVDICASVYVRLTPDGTDADEAFCGDQEWDDASPAMCGECGWSGTVADLVEVEQDGDDEEDGEEAEREAIQFAVNHQKEADRG